MFIDREKELAILNKTYASKNFEFISIIGRRRVGKTELIKRFIKNKKNTLYIYVSLEEDKDLRRNIATNIFKKFKVSFLEIPDWKTIFETLFKLSKKERTIICFDEFQRLSSVNPSIPSILQNVIDSYKDKSKLYLIISGSSIGMMNSLFKYNSPLYGRRTKQLSLSAFDYENTRKWFKKLKEEERIKLYGVFGGTPAYLECTNAFLENKNLIKTISDEILSSESKLYVEPTLLLKTEVKDAKAYISILAAIMRGKTTNKEISENTEIITTSLNYYINVLINNLDLLEKINPATDDPEKSKKSQYLIKDNFFKFWFKYVLPNKSELELDNKAYVTEKIEKDINADFGKIYENIVIELFKKYSGKEIKGIKLDRFKRVGKWWDRNRNEIDLCAVSAKGILLGEVKYTNTLVSEKEVRKLLEKRKLVKHVNQLVLVSKNGFTKGCRQVCAENNVLTLTLKDITRLYNKLNK